GRHRLGGGSGEGGDDVGVGGVDDVDVGGLQPGALQGARQEVLRHRILHQVHRPALDVGQLVRALQHHPVIAVGVVAHHHDGGVAPAGGGDGQGVHVGGGDAVELAGGVLVQALDIVVDLHQLD